MHRDGLAPILSTGVSRHLHNCAAHNAIDIACTTSEIVILSASARLLRHRPLLAVSVSKQLSAVKLQAPCMDTSQLLAAAAR
jgi:hypothetical protein